MTWRWCVALLLAAPPLAAGAEAPGELRAQAAAALRRGVEFFRREVAVNGTYLWQYSEDLTRREGEGRATADQGWVQPPGTPAVGLALLEAYEATGDAFHLDAARATAQGLARGQLRSGGWTYVIDFSPAGRKKYAYRDGGKPDGRNVSTLDDDTTQCALRFLARADRALGFTDAVVRAAARAGLEAVLGAQYPNGAWPQGFVAPPDPARFPVKKARLPEAWSREWPGSQEYWFRYTLNDGLLADLVPTLLEAGRIYGGPAGRAEDRALAVRCAAAARKAGDFLLLAQFPEPQPGWAQQYDTDLQPAWARKFEPPAVTGGESQGALKTLLLLYRETGERKYLDPIPPALAWFKRARLPDGQLARFYEPITGKPLYFTRDYRLTYDDKDCPTHYAFKVGDGTAALARDYEKFRDTPKEKLTPREEARPKLSSGLEADARKIIAAQDAKGRWVEDGRLQYHGEADPTRRVIRCATFIKNVEALSRYLAASAPLP